MTGMVRARYTLEFKQEAVRLVRGGQSLSSVARGLGVSAQSIDNWVKADAIGGLKEAKGKPVNADQMEIARLRSEAHAEAKILGVAKAWLDCPALGVKVQDLARPRLGIAGGQTPGLFHIPGFGGCIQRRDPVG